MTKPFMYEYVEIVKLLINNSAAVNQADNKGFTPLYAASQNDHHEVVKVLIVSNASINQT